TRNEALLAQCNIVVDVGAAFDPSKLRFDHHQREFTGTMSTSLKSYSTRLSSAGLIYQQYGRELIRGYADFCHNERRLSARLTEAEIELLFDRVYKGFIEHIDGVDNGVEEYALTEEARRCLSAAGISAPMVRNYRSTTGLSER